MELVSGSVQAAEPEPRRSQVELEVLEKRIDI
jgi:hypothetical protein